MDEEIIYFELNNWISKDDYPDAEPFKTWCGNDLKLHFDSERWVKENKLVVTRGIIDMSVNWCIGATKKWAEDNCPDLLTEYKEFLRPTMDSKFGQPFIEYSEDNIGITYYEESYETGEWELVEIEDEDLEEFAKWKEDINKEIYGDK